MRESMLKCVVRIGYRAFLLGVAGGMVGLVQRPNVETQLLTKWHLLCHRQKVKLLAGLHDDSLKCVFRMGYACIWSVVLTVVCSLATMTLRVPRGSRRLRRLLS